jgi:hypothetical protein
LAYGSESSTASVPSSGRRRRGRRRTRVTRPRWSAQRRKKKKAARCCAPRGGAPRLGSWRQMLGQLLRRLEARRGGSHRWRPTVGSRGTTSAAERGRARWQWCWRFEQTLLFTEDKAEDKDGGTGARGGAAWPARGGREGRWHGAQLQLARSELIAARSK